MANYRSGFVTLIGRPNVGKSTLLNRFVGVKVSITSPKPQTTRRKLQAILTGDDYQVVFLDTPGVHTPKHLLGEAMVRNAVNALEEVDLILFIVEAGGLVEEDLGVVKKLKKLATPVFVLLNKIDAVRPEVMNRTQKEVFQYHLGKTFCISALSGEGIEELQREIVAKLPEGPQYYPPDLVTDHPEQFIIAELIREQVLSQTFDEVPHSVMVRVEEMAPRQDKDLTDIRAVVYTEKDSQKGIIIGNQGKRLKEIAQKARLEIETLLGTQIYLQLWVKVRKNWRNSQEDLKNFGFLE